ncbi:hypothetical protein EZV73_13695 [Acidaminobacter sp. JC074]|uniref:hypothetical protein n=1 Tax=Acidaminobacter sp. JC074 TaxID=2530199 RepID=UPI001F10781C|nr:hypothetical protein [Acidaminobacter sp. JC074]MCH4888641.1 hypothetical protein [Acidaminobacter sp. JC074]
MKKVILSLLIIIFLVSCQDGEKYSEIVVKDNQIEFDGIYYDVQSVLEMTYEYNVKDQVAKTVLKFNDETSTSEFYYDNDLLVEEKRISPHMTNHVYYEYDDGRKVKQTFVSDAGNLITEFEYEEDKRKITFYDTDGSISHYNEGFVDEDGNIIDFVSYDKNDVQSSHTVNTFEENLMIRSVSETVDGTSFKSYYEYDKFGNKTFAYRVRFSEDILMYLDFYEYEYKKDLIVHMKKYRVQSVIEENQIRSYWD